MYSTAIYRGCTDGFTDVPSLEYSYVGCRNQTWNNRNLRWCICNTTLCNGDSLESMSRRRGPSGTLTDRLRLTPPPPPPYRRPADQRAPAKTDQDRDGRVSVASDDAKAGFYQSWIAEPIYRGGPYLWNPNNRPDRMYIII